MAKRVGRPSKYKKIYAKKLLECFEIEPFRQVVIKKLNKNGEMVEETVTEPVLLPTITDFSSKIGVDESTIKEWAEAKRKNGKPKYPEFSESYYRAKKLQKNIWMKLSLLGKYNPYFAGLVGKNMYGWKDKSEVESKHEGSITINRVSYKDLE